MNVQKYWSTHVTPILQQMADCVINVFTFWHSRRARRKGDTQGGGGGCKDGVGAHFGFGGGENVGGGGRLMGLHMGGKGGGKGAVLSPGNCTGIPRSASTDDAAQSGHNGPGCRGQEISECDSICVENFESIVKLPPLLDLNEWLASHCLAFFNHINLLYSSVSCQFCTAESCPVMTGPGNVQYPWLDERGKKMKCSGPQYVDYVMSSIQELVRGEETFPTKYGNTFPANADATFRRISRLLWHVLSHMYSSHLKHFANIGLCAQLTTVTEHFVSFCAEFDLITDSKESAAMAEIVQNIHVFRQASSMELSTSSAPPTTSESQLAEFTKAGDTNLLLTDSGEDKAGGGGISPSASSDAGISDTNSESRQLIPSTATQPELLSDDRLLTLPRKNRAVDQDEDSDDGNRYSAGSRRTTMDVEAVINPSPPQLPSSPNSTTAKSLGGSPISPPPPNYSPPPPMRDYLTEDPSFLGQNDCDNGDQFSPEDTFGLDEGRSSSEGLDMDLTLAPTAIPITSTNSLLHYDVNNAKCGDSPYLGYQNGAKTTENVSYYQQNFKDILSGYEDNKKIDPGMANASYNSSMIDSGFIDTTSTAGPRCGDPSTSAVSTPQPPLPRGGSGNFRIPVPSNPFGGRRSTPSAFPTVQKSPQRHLIDNQSPHRHGFPKIRSLSRSSRNNCDISDHKTSVTLDSTSKLGVQLTSASPISRVDARMSGAGTHPQSHNVNFYKVPPIVDDVGSINPEPATSGSDSNGELSGPGHVISPSTPSGSDYLPQSCDMQRTPLTAAGAQVLPVWTGGKNFDSAIASQPENNNYPHHRSSDNDICNNDAATNHISGSSRETNFNPTREGMKMNPIGLPMGVGGGPLLDSMLSEIHPGSRGGSLGGLTVDTTLDHRYLTSASERVDPLNLDPKRVGFSAEETRRDNFCERHLNQSLNQANSRYHCLSANLQNRAISSSSTGCRGEFGNHSGNGSATNFPLAVSMSGSPVKRGKESVGTVGKYFGRGSKQMTSPNQDSSTSSTSKCDEILLDGICNEYVGNNENFVSGWEAKGEPRVEGRVGGRRSRTATGSRSSGKGSSADSVTSQSSIPLVEMQA